MSPRPVTIEAADAVDRGERVYVCLACGERLEVGFERVLVDGSALPRRWAEWHLEAPHTILDRDVRDYCAVV